MKKTLILYKSRFGSTKQYAEWLQEKIRGADLYPVDDFDSGRISKYDQIIIGSMTYMGKISALNFLTENWDKMKEKEVFLFAVGMFPPEAPESIRSYEMIPANIRKAINYVKLPGRLDYAQLNLFQKAIVKMVKTPQAGKFEKGNIEKVLKSMKK